MEEIYSIREISEFLKISKSTLRYWESEGLFASSRNRENNYREFSFDLLLDIGDIAFYRGLGVPVQNLKEARKMTLENIDSTLSTAMAETEETITRLQEKKKSIELRLWQLAEVRRLQDSPYAEGRPDFGRAIAVDYTNRDHWRQYLSTPEKIVLYAEADDPRGYRNGLLLGEADEAAGTLLWKESAGDAARYFECLVKINCDRREGGNIRQHIETLSEKGCKPRRIVARYLANTFDGEPWENYRAWIEVEP